MIGGVGAMAALLGLAARPGGGDGACAPPVGLLACGLAAGPGVGLGFAGGRFDRSASFGAGILSAPSCLRFSGLAAPSYPARYAP
jgi:hypothetical protein